MSRVRAPEGACKVLVPQFVCGVGAFFYAHFESGDVSADSRFIYMVIHMVRRKQELVTFG